MPLVVHEPGPDTRVLLVHAPYPGRLKFEGQPSSLLTAAGPLVRELEQAGRLAEVGLLDPPAPSEDFYAELECLAAGGRLRVACISTSTAAIEEAARVAQVLRAAAGPELLVVAGGPHEDDCPVPMAERLSEVDLSIGGDAEDALAAIATAYLGYEALPCAFLERVPGLLGSRPRGRGAVTRKGGNRWTWHGAESMPVTAVLDRPWASRAVRFSVFEGRETLPVMLSRGCSYGQCTFCAEAHGAGQQVAEDFASLVHLLDAHPRAAIYFQDSIFPATRTVRERLLPLLRDTGRPWGCQVYLPTLSRGFARLLAQHGCTYVYTGVESGSEVLRAAVGKRGLRDSLVRERLLWLAEENLRVGLSLMFGILDASGALVETEQSVESTVAFSHQCLADGVIVEGFYPNVMTVLPATAVAAGFARAGVELDFYRMPRVHEFTGLEDGEVGYNFASLPGLAGNHGSLVEAVREAAAHLASLGRVPATLSVPPL